MIYKHLDTGLIIKESEKFLLKNKVILPGRTVLNKLIINLSTTVYERTFENIYLNLSNNLKIEIDKILTVSENKQSSFFNLLKKYPPRAKITSLQEYLNYYFKLTKTGIDSVKHLLINPFFTNYLFKITKHYTAKDLKRFKNKKRYALMICFLLESKKIFLDHILKMHDQYVIDLIRKTKNTYEIKLKEFRKKQKKAIDNVIEINQLLLDWPYNHPIYKKDILKNNEERLRDSIENLKTFQILIQNGLEKLLLKKYPSFRKYFNNFIQLPFSSEKGASKLIKAIDIVKSLDAGILKTIPKDAPISFVPKKLKLMLKDKHGNINRNAWELGLAIAIKEFLRSGDLYVSESKYYVSFWNLVLNKSSWNKIKKNSYKELEQSKPKEVKNFLKNKFHETIVITKKAFKKNNFAEINGNKLKLKRLRPSKKYSFIKKVQKIINGNIPFIRIEQLLLEVDKLVNFTKHFKPIQKHKSKPNNFYKTLISAIISQATNLGIVSMSVSVKGITVDMLRHVLNYYIREETLKAANEKIVNKHHLLPLSSVHGSGNISSSDGQRFKIRANSLLSSHYPRYYGYYERAIGIYTHISDQYSVFSTKVISCSPREALYVLDGLLENNTILKIDKHTTDTHGYTEIIFALCYLLGYYFMPRIKDLKDQQLYRIDNNFEYGSFKKLLNKKVNLKIIEEQWETMIHVAYSLKKKTAPAHTIVQRLTNSYPADRLSKAFTNLGRIIKTEYILKYITDSDLRKTVQLQLNKGEYRHKLPRWIFFANQGEFTTGDYEEIMNKASCLSLVSNAILYWNTIKINQIVENLKKQNELINDNVLSHISLLPFKHILPSGAYFVED